MNQLQAMRVFTRVVELGSFTMAARQLGMSCASVTRCVGMPEAHLNTRLLNRNTRSLSLTEIGKDYLKGCRSLIEQLEELESSLLQANREVRGTPRCRANGLRCVRARRAARGLPGDATSRSSIISATRRRAKTKRSTRPSTP